MELSTSTSYNQIEYATMTIVDIPPSWPLMLNQTENETWIK